MVFRHHKTRAIQLAFRCHKKEYLKVHSFAVYGFKTEPLLNGRGFCLSQASWILIDINEEIPALLNGGVVVAPSFLFAASRALYCSLMCNHAWTSRIAPC